MFTFCVSVKHYMAKIQDVSVNIFIFSIFSVWILNFNTRTTQALSVQKYDLIEFCFLMDLRRMWKSYPFRNSYRSLISSRTRRPTLLMCNELHSRVLYRTYSVSSIDFLSGQLNVMRENQEKNNVKTYRYLRHARKCYFHHWQSKIILIHENYIILSHLLLY